MERSTQKNSNYKFIQIVTVDFEIESRTVFRRKLDFEKKDYLSAELQNIIRSFQN